MSVSAALILLAATAWLASPLRPERAQAEPSAAPEPPLECEGIAVRDELIVPRPDGEYIVLAADGKRAAAGAALLASADTDEGLAQAVRDAARDDPTVAVAAARQAAGAAATDDERGAFMLRALYSPDSDSSYTLVTAPKSAVWTSAPDGYEYLSADMLTDISLERARELIGGEANLDEGAAGKLIGSDEWRFLTVLPEERAPQSGARVTLYFDGFSVEALTEYVGEPSGGECAVVFVSDELPERAITLRRAAAEIIPST